MPPQEKPQWPVTRASSAEEAIQLLDVGEVQFDVVLSDVVMPGGMNGVSFAQYLRKNLPEMPIILITYATHEDAVRRALAAVQHDKIINGRPQVIRIEKN